MVKEAAEAGGPVQPAVAVAGTSATATPASSERHGENPETTCGELGRAHRAATSPLI
jgi:hypothetical protein